MNATYAGHDLRSTAKSQMRGVLKLELETGERLTPGRTVLHAKPCFDATFGRRSSTYDAFVKTLGLC